MREKLIALLNLAPTDYAGNSNPIRTADYLIANGVTVQKQERWEHGYKNGQYGIWCSGCGAGFAYSDVYEVLAATHEFCPKCGAKMTDAPKDGDSE